MTERVVSAPGDPDIVVPRGQAGLTSRLLSGPTLPDWAARAGARLAPRGGPLRLGRTVVAVTHEHVREALSRDLDFSIAPVNAGRIGDVARCFVLGMDRQAALACERRALYRALADVDMAPIAAAAEASAVERVALAPGTLDVVGDYARPIAAATARLLFGIAGPDERTFADVARAIFCHTFLNLSGDAAVRARAARAATMLNGWIDDEIARRRHGGAFGSDMMGALLGAGLLDDDGVRRTLAGMLVGSIDTTASAVAKIVAVLARDDQLAASAAADADDPELLRGWCWEALRRWPHNPILLRHAMRDTRLAGTKVKAGDRVILWTQAAMMDASVFPEPDSARPDRPAGGYLHFGGQLHGCAGRAVNAWQIPMLVAALLRRGMASVGAVEWAGPFPDRLDVTFTP